MPNTAGSRSSRRTEHTRSASRWWRSATSLAGGAPLPRAAVLLPPAGQDAVLPWAVLCCRGRRVTGRVPSAYARADYCDIRINLLTVSREHAEIVVDEDNQVCGRGSWRARQPRGAGVLQLRVPALFCACATQEVGCPAHCAREPSGTSCPVGTRSRHAGCVRGSSAYGCRSLAPSGLQSVSSFPHMAGGRRCGSTL